MTFPQHPFGTTIDQTELARRLNGAHGWEAKNRLLVQLAREIPDFPADLRTDANRINGCESRVWLLAQQEGDRWQIAADSDSRIVKGLLALILAAYHNRSSTQIAAFDLPGWLEELGLQRFLTASRGNGLRAIAQRIRNLNP